MTDWLAVIMLGIIEGITEFLPISSTGHLLIAEKWLGSRGDLFVTVIQCGTVLAVLLAFSARMKQLCVGWRDRATQTYLAKLLLAFVITGMGGLLLKKMDFKFPETAAPVAWALLIGGILILGIEQWLKDKPLKDEVTWSIAAMVGLAQLAAAVFPGTSRSGATILVALALGMSRPIATEFSFLLGIPTLLAAGGLQIYSASKQGEVVDWPMVFVGALAAAVTAFIAVRWLLRYVQRHTFVAFGWYRIGLAAAILLLANRPSATPPRPDASPLQGTVLNLFAAAAPGPREVLPTLGRWEAITFAGTGQSGLAGDGSAATNAQLNNPFGLVRGPGGALFICDTDNHVIRKVAREGTISTVAGTGKRGFSGDGGPALQADLNEPYEIRFDKAGNMFFVEMKNHLVRRVDAKTQLISTIAGTGKPGFSGDGGPAVKAALHQPHSIQLDAQDNVYICDIGNHRVRRLDTKSGVISTFAGTGGKGPTPDGARIAGTPLFGPRAIDFDKEGNLWLALREGNAVYKLDLKGGNIHHMAGTGKKGFTGHGGPAKNATLSGPKGLSVGPDGNIYLADTESHSIRMIELKRGTLELIAGTGERGDGPEGNPLACKMARPHGVFVDADGTVLVGDSEAHRVRAIRRAR